MVWKISDETAFDTLGEEVRLTINGISIRAPQNQSLLVTARQNGLRNLCETELQPLLRHLSRRGAGEGPNQKSQAR